MDLGVFLHPGNSLPLAVTAGEDGLCPPAQGRLETRRGRPVWLCSAPQPPGRTLVLTVELPGFSLTEDGGLAPAGPNLSAEITLLSRVRACRFFPTREVYVLKLELLGRIWPDSANLR